MSFISVEMSQCLLNTVLPIVSASISSLWLSNSAGGSGFLSGWTMKETTQLILLYQDTRHIGFGLHTQFFHLLGLLLGVPGPGVSTPKFLGVRPSGVRPRESCVWSLSFSPTDSWPEVALVVASGGGVSWWFICVSSWSISTVRIQ